MGTNIITHFWKQNLPRLGTRLLLHYLHNINNSYEYLFRALSVLQGWTTSSSRAVVHMGMAFNWGHTSCTARLQMVRYGDIILPMWHLITSCQFGWMSIEGTRRTPVSAMTVGHVSYLGKSSADSADHSPYIAPSSVALPLPTSSFACFRCQASAG